MNIPVFRNALVKYLSRLIKVRVWASFVSAFMLIGIGWFWVLHPTAAETSFSMTVDSGAALRFSKITAIFKAVGDLLPPIFVLMAIGHRQFRLAGLFHMATLFLVIIIDMITLGSVCAQCRTT